MSRFHMDRQGHHSLKTEMKKREAMFGGVGEERREIRLVLDLTDLRHLKSPRRASTR